MDNLQVSRQRCGRITNIFRSLMCLCVQHPHHNRFAGMHSIVESRLLRRLLKWVSFFPVVSSFFLCVFLAVTFFFVLLFHCAICVFLLQCFRLLLPSSKCTVDQKMLHKVQCFARIQPFSCLLITGNCTTLNAIETEDSVKANPCLYRTWQMTEGR